MTTHTTVRVRFDGTMAQDVSPIGAIYNLLDHGINVLELRMHYSTRELYLRFLNAPGVAERLDALRTIPTNADRDMIPGEIVIVHGG